MIIPIIFYSKRRKLCDFACSFKKQTKTNTILFDSTDILIQFYFLLFIYFEAIK
jgi:hypothetical protein